MFYNIYYNSINVYGTSKEKKKSSVYGMVLYVSLQHSMCLELGWKLFVVYYKSCSKGYMASKKSLPISTLSLSASLFISHQSFF